MRPIDAQKAKDRIEQIFCEDCVRGNKCMRCSLSVCFTAIDDVPTLDVAPVVHGEWIDAEYDEYELEFGRHQYFCSVCEKHADSFVGGSEEWWCRRKPNYCPNCGAKMDGKEQTDADN